MMTPEQLSELRNVVMDQETQLASPAELEKSKQQLALAKKIADKIDEALGMEKSCEPPVSRLESQICGLLDALAKEKRSANATQPGEVP